MMKHRIVGKAFMESKPKPGRTVYKEIVTEGRDKYLVREELPELHENADLSMHFLQLVEHVNPRNIVLEEVPQYLKSGVGTATMNALT